MKKRPSLTKVLEILQEFGINKPVKINLLKRSTQSYNFLIQCKDGKKLILKEYLEKNKKISIELDFISYLHKLKPKFYPKIFKTFNGKTYFKLNGKYFCLMSYIDGKFLDSENFSINNFYEFGRRLAEFHIDAKNFKKRGTPKKKDLFQRLILKSEKFFTDIVNFSKINKISRQIDLLIKNKRFKKGILHNDFTDWNVKFKGDSISGVFDFSDFSYGPLISDIATSITEICFSRNILKKGAMIAFIKGYKSRREIPLEEIKFIPLLMEKRAIFIIKYCMEKFLTFYDNSYIDFIKDYYKKLLYLEKEREEIKKYLIENFKSERQEKDLEKYLNFNIFLTKECNLNCVYCGENFLQKQLPKEVTYSIIDLKNFFSKKKNSIITFYGGEPLLRIELLKRIIDKVPAKYFMLQTNGIFLDKLKSFYLNKFHTILVSIDGRKRTTDFYRGRGVFDKIIENMKKIKKKGFKGEIIARMTVSEHTKEIDKEVLFLLKNKFFKFEQVHWQLNVMFDEEKEDWKIPFKIWVKKYYKPSLKRLVDVWIKEMKRGKLLKILPFIGIVNSLLKEEPSLLRCGAGISFFNIFTDGNIAACPVMRGVPKYYLGNLKSDPSKLRNSIFVGYPCNFCKYYTICGGRCLFANITKKWGEEGYKQVCDTVIFLINQIKNNLPIIKSLIKRGFINKEDFEYTKNNGCEIIP
ncbi:MAG: TIGR04084 family radical SAM/SPASM domain-containing protein [Candidatus Pacearchaeota archaeon]